MKLPNGLRRNLWGVALLPTALLFNTPLPAQSQAYEAGAAQKLAADANTIVDCLLPGAVRRLGAGVTYLAARKPVLLKTAECEVRGGEYVLYDRADPKIAFKIWEAAAKAGDADAQRRLAQIYEMGVGTEPDFKNAAAWYRKSAEQGNHAAAMALAALYEAGLGVAKDPEEARRWYERARTPSTKGDSGPSRDVERLTRELQEKERKVAELEAKLTQGAATSQAELAQAKQALNDSLKQAEAQAAPGALLESRRERPVIELVDPNLVRAGPSAAYNIRGQQVQVKKITGWVNLGPRLGGVTVNGTGAELDQNGFFSQSVTLQGASTPVSIVALSKDGKRDELNFAIKTGTPTVTDIVEALREKPPAGVGRLHALVIGINGYRQWPKLETAVDDAKTVAGVLSKKFGYKTNLLIDATADDIINALNDYALTLRDNDVLIIYYAGHGQLDTRNKRAYWVPVDGETQRDTHWIPSYRVTDLVNKMKARKVLVISDSCYSGGLAADLTGVVTGVRPGLGDDGRARAVGALWDVVSRTILTSGMLAPVLDDEGAGKAKHSMFARALLEVLDETNGVMTGDGLYTAVQARVVYRSQKLKFDQTPFYTGLAHAGHEGGDFILVPVAAR
ncbi:MAG: caspase family protein [Burkholderiales bacterium]|nr:caspase family protein [Burkholderiales bacterium]